MLENDDLRKGMVRFEDQYFYSKVRSRYESNINGTTSHSLFNFQVVDLPCVVESLKTIDKKSFYKTADICQMVRDTLIPLSLISTVSNILDDLSSRAIPERRSSREGSSKEQEKGPKQDRQEVSLSSWANSMPEEREETSIQKDSEEEER